MAIFQNLDSGKIKEFMPFAVVGTILGVLGFAYNQNQKSKNTDTTTGADTGSGNISQADLEGLMQAQSTDYNNNLQSMTNQVNASISKFQSQLSTDENNISSNTSKIASNTTKITSATDSISKINSANNDLYNKVHNIQSSINSKTANTANTTSNPSRPTTAWDGRDYGSGASGGNVYLIQHQLENKGYSVGGGGFSNTHWDGVIGGNTSSAIRTFQANNGLQVDGIVGQQTWNKLFS